MQLIRHKLEVTEHMQIATIVYKHKEYFDRAADSVLKNHNIESEYKDMFDAAEMLYRSIFPPPGKNDLRYYVVQHLDHRTNLWIDIKWWDKENGFVLADPDERLDHNEALKRLSSMNIGKLLTFRISTKYEARK